MTANTTIAAFNHDHGKWSHLDCLLVFNLRVAAGLTDDQIAAVLNAIESTCPHCWDAPRGCQCWNDE